MTATQWRWAAGALTVLTAGMVGCSVNVGGGGVSIGGGPQVKGSGVVKSETRPVAGFHAVSLTGIGKVFVEVTGKEGLTIKAEDNLLPLLTSEVKDGTLALGVKPNTSISSTKPIEFHVEAKELTDLTVTGTGSLEARGVKASRLTVHLTGTGSATLAGSADELDLSVSGTGSFHGDRLPAKRVTVEVTGTGKAVVYATETLNATVSGVGSVEYLGDPKQFTQSVTGVGKVRKR